MRKIELDAHIKKEGIEDLQEYGFSRAKLKIGHTGELDYYNITLTVMVPDEPGRKVLISENDFEEAWVAGYDNAGKDLREMKEHIKAELFGGKS